MRHTCNNGSEDVEEEPQCVIHVTTVHRCSGRATMSHTCNNGSEDVQEDPQCVIHVTMVQKCQGRATMRHTRRTVQKMSRKSHNASYM